MESNINLVRRCLTLISRIAARGARSPFEEHICDTLMELTYALDQSRRRMEAEGDDFESPRTRTLKRLLEELEYIDSTSEPLKAQLVLKYMTRNMWN